MLAHAALLVVPATVRYKPSLYLQTKVKYALPSPAVFSVFTSVHAVQGIHRSLSASQVRTQSVPTVYGYDMLLVIY